MGVSRSGYYKWRARPKENPDSRQTIIDLVCEAHGAHPSHGYRWIHAYLVQQKGITVSPDYIRKAFRYLNIESKTKHKVHSKPRKVRDPYPNLIFSTWETVDRPRQVIVSDMMSFWTRYNFWELTLYFDVFTKQILGRGITKKRGWPEIYYDGLKQALPQLERSDEEEPTVFHTDQGTVYTSMAYNELIKDYNVVRSCSRAGKPTDNPVNESLNGWIKEELFIDFNLYDAPDIVAAIGDYIEFYNSVRPSYSLNYDTPDNYYRRFMNGEIKTKDTFRHRILDETPKFIRKMILADSEAQGNQPSSAASEMEEITTLYSGIKMTVST